MKTHSALISLCLLAMSSTAFANPKTEYAPLLNNQYKKLLSGKTIKGEYRYLRERSKTFNFSEKHNTDGSTFYKEGDIETPGIWYTLGEQKICYKYPKGSLMGGGTSCFWVFESDTCYYGYNLPQMSLKGPRNYENWTARWVIQGSGGSCDAPVT